MTRSNAGGSATSAGIDFQQRVAALFLVEILLDKNHCFIFEGHTVEEARFETNDKIDDIVLITNKSRIFIQAKRSVSLSDRADSEYSNVLKQFVSQYIADNQQGDMYALATSSKSSQKIIKELRKLTESIRLNEKSYIENPLTQIEEEVLHKTEKLINEHYLTINGSRITDGTFQNIFKRINILLLDIEDGTSLEKAVIMFLTKLTNTTSNILLWKYLISLSLTLAKERLSINQKGLLNKVENYIEDSAKNNDLRKEFFQLQLKGDFPVINEILLIDSFLEDADFLIIKLNRFESDGNKVLKFYDNKVELPDGRVWTLIFRAATFAGMKRFLSDHKDRYSQEKIIIITSDVEQENNFEFVKIYSEKCKKLIKKADNLFGCLHCDNDISEDKTPIIEIDEENIEYQIGLVHERCLRPIDRVIGIIESNLFSQNELLTNFDYTTWFHSEITSQKIFDAELELNSPAHVLWNPNYNEISKGGWCIKINMDNGGANYVHKRGRVQRCSEAEARTLVIEFNKNIEKAKVENDPWCYTSDGVFTTYTNAIKIMKKRESISLCVGAIPVPYTKSIGKAYSNFNSYYAPLVLLLEQDTALPIKINNTIFLISDPLKLEKYTENWRYAGIILPDFTVSIIETDFKFDKFMSQNTNENIVVNPLLSMSGELLSGFVIQNYAEFITN